MSRQRSTPRHHRDRPRRAVFLLGAALPVLLVAFVVVIYLSRPDTGGQELRLDEWLALVGNGDVRDATLLDQDSRIMGTYTGGSYWVAFPDREAAYSTILTALQNAGVPTRVEQQWSKTLIGPMVVLLPALIFVDAFFLLFLLMRQGGLHTFGRARAHLVDRGTTFEDVAGVDEAVGELRDIKDYLEDPDRFLRVGARVPRGVLLAGAPGCGKTLLARALAGEAGVPFYSISGSDFVEIFVGVGASRIRDLFRRARQNAPAIVFIDELDAVGRGRQAIAVGGQDEREATLNQLLVEMDGIEQAPGLVVLAATNRPDILDTALLRPGRFDRRVVIDRPDLRGRWAILEVHVRGKPLAPDVDLEAIARKTPGFSGADLENVINEAAILASRRAQPTITMTLLHEAVERAVAGPERRTRIIGEHERAIIATHEAGHTIVAAALPQADAPSKVSIVARGQALGYTFVEPAEERVLATRDQLTARLTTLLAGRAAERMVLGQPSTGSQDDLLHATRLAESMVRKLGMSDEMGALVLGREDEDGSQLLALQHSEAVAGEADAAIRRTLADAERSAALILQENRTLLDELVALLLETETLEGAQLELMIDRVEAASPLQSATRREGVSPPPYGTSAHEPRVVEESKP